MNRKRQNNQQELALEPKDRGEAPARGDEETEPFMAKSATENPAFSRLNSIEPPCTDPYARWCGRGGAERLPPIPIFGTKRTCKAIRWMSAIEEETDITPTPCYFSPAVTGYLGSTMIRLITAIS